MKLLHVFLEILTCLSMLAATGIWFWIWRMVNDRQSKFVERLDRLECEINSITQLLSKVDGIEKESYLVWSESESALTESPSDLAYMKERGFL